MKDKQLFYMPKSFIFTVFMTAKFCFKTFCFKKHRMTLPHKIVINVNIGTILTWKFQKTFTTKFGLLKNCGRPKAGHNFSTLKETFWQGKIYPSPRIGLIPRMSKFLQFCLFDFLCQCLEIKSKMLNVRNLKKLKELPN